MNLHTEHKAKVTVEIRGPAIQQAQQADTIASAMTRDTKYPEASLYTSVIRDGESYRVVFVHTYNLDSRTFSLAFRLNLLHDVISTVAGAFVMNGGIDCVMLYVDIEMQIGPRMFAHFVDSYRSTENAKRTMHDLLRAAQKFCRKYEKWCPHPAENAL